MRNFSDTFTQGGQTQLHKFRMINQVFGTTTKVSSIIGLAGFLFLVFYDNSWEKFVFLFTFYKSQIRDSMSYLPREFFDSSWILHGDGKYYEISDHIIANKQEYIISSIFIQGLLCKKLFQAFLIFISSMVLMFSYWIYRGRDLKTKEIVSGSDLVPINKLIRLIRKNKKNSDLLLSNLPLIKDSETKHMLIVGTTGAGKTNTFNHLLPQIRTKDQKAIIVDTTGTFVEKFYDPETDILLNPLDARSASWSLWKECQTEVQIDDFTSSIIPQTLHDQFWSDASRLLFSETIKILQRNKDHSVKKLLDYAIHKPLAKIQQFYAGTQAASLVDIAADKTAASIRVTLSTHLKSLHLIEDEKDGFSIQEWVKDDSKRGWLFLAAMPDQRETLRPLMSSWLNIAINALMACRPDQERRLWFIIDEKQSLNKIEALPKALAEIRKYGGCIVSGLQNISQIDKLYGHETRKTMSSLYNTKVFFRSPDTDTAQWISKMVGEHEILENNEGISYGAHQMRDGVSINEQKKQKSIIPYSEFMDLKDLEAYIKLPENYPVTKITFNYKSLESKNQAFNEKPIKLKTQNERKLEERDESVELDNDIKKHSIPETLNFNLLKIKE